MSGERSAFFSSTILISIASDDLIFATLSLPMWQQSTEKGVRASPARSWSASLQMMLFLLGFLCWCDSDVGKKRSAFFSSTNLKRIPSDGVILIGFLCSCDSNVWRKGPWQPWTGLLRMTAVVGICFCFYLLICWNSLDIVSELLDSRKCKKEEVWYPKWKQLF